MFIIKKHKINDKKVSAIIACAGYSMRMDGLDKINEDIDGFPVAVRSIRAFEFCDAIDEIIVVCKEQDVGIMLTYKDIYELTKIKKIVVGGKTRQESVFNGVKEVSEDVDIVAIHDGARPFVSIDVIYSCVEACKQYGAVTCGVKTKDTIKVVSEDMMIKDTPNRSLLYITQTPQVFDINVYKKAMENAIFNDYNFTDDCQLVENIGENVYMVQGEYKNIKITTQEDISFAKIYAEDNII